MGLREKIVERAKFWASPGEWRPTASHLVDFFKEAGAERWPTLKEAEQSLKQRSTGVYLGNEVKHWCGIFACFVIREMGLTTPRWTLYGGKIKNLALIWGHKDMQPGDIAIIPRASHHFIVTSIDYGKMKLDSVDGNQMGQLIKAYRNRDILPKNNQAEHVIAYYRVSG